LAGNTWIFLGGAAAVAGLGYYLHQAGYFNSIFDAINKAIDDIKNTKPLPDGKEEEKPKPKPGGCEDGGLVKCKDGKCGKQSDCDKQAKCKSTEKWSSFSKKCVVKTTSKLAMAFNTPLIGVARYRAFRVYRT